MIYALSFTQVRTRSSREVAATLRARMMTVLPSSLPGLIEGQINATTMSEASRVGRSGDRLRTLPAVVFAPPADVVTRPTRAGAAAPELFLAISRAGEALFDFLFHAGTVSSAAFFKHRQTRKIRWGVQ